MSDNRRRLSDEDVREIRRLHALRRSLSYKAIARRFGVAYEYVRKIVRRKARTAA